MLQKSTSAIFLGCSGSVVFCSQVAEPANGGLDQRVPDGCALLRSELHCALFAKRVGVISDWH